MIRLEPKAIPPARLSLEGILPERLGDMAEADIAALPVRCGARSLPLGEFFSVTRSGAAEGALVIVGDARLDDVAAGMTRDEILVEGDVGASLGRDMAGGRVMVSGSAEWGVASAMRGGEIIVRGDVGDQLGAALPGEQLGMSGGKVVVLGNAGSAVGDRMRRGLVVVAGTVGPFCAARMRAGTLVVGGALGAHPGIAMRRGTLVALDADPPIPASFVPSGTHELVFARLLARSLAGCGLDDLLPRLDRLRRWAGDLAVGGMGEILVAN